LKTPQSTKKIGAAYGVTPDKSKRRVAICRPLNLQSLLRREKAGEAFRQPPDRINIQGVDQYAWMSFPLSGKKIARKGVVT
jgi:hypothetical protein